MGEFQARAAIAALHADARTVEETDWMQIVEWYDELVRLTDRPVAGLNRAVAVGEADGPRAGLAALAELDLLALPPWAARVCVAERLRSCMSAHSQRQSLPCLTADAGSHGRAP